MLPASCQRRRMAVDGAGALGGRAPELRAALQTLERLAAQKR